METIFSQFNEVAEVVEGIGAYTSTMLTAKFRAPLPPKIQKLMSQQYMEETMRRMWHGRWP